MQELKPCPFCGSEAIVYESVTYHEEGQQKAAVIVKCYDCGGTQIGESIVDALFRWNERRIPFKVLQVGNKRNEATWVKESHHIECSKCRIKAPYKKIKAGYHLRHLSDYCPNCGARMTGGWFLG